MFMPISLSNSLPTSLALSLLLVVHSQVANAQSLTFTQQQVDAGKATYREVCQICHGSSLANGQFGTPSVTNPSSVSSWPFGGRPRSATVAIQRIDGGEIGT